MTQLRWVLPLLVTGSPVGRAYSQTTIENSKPLSSSIAVLDLTPTESSQLSDALAAHDYAASERLLLDEINRDPSSLRAARLLAFIGHIYFLSADYVSAAIAWKKSEKIAPLEPSLQFSLAMVYVRLNHPDWARPILQHLSTDLPKEPLYPYWLGRLDYDAQQYDRAIAHFQQALVIQPTMTRAYDNLGLCYFYLNNTALALDTYTKAIELDRNSPQPSAWPHLNLAIALHFVNRLDEAEAQLHEALRLDPKLAQAHFELGLVLATRDHFDAAVRALSEAAKLDAGYAEPHYALARVYRRQGQRVLAQQEVEIFKRLRAQVHPATYALIP